MYILKIFQILRPTILIFLFSIGHSLTAQSIETVIGNKTPESGILGTNMRLGRLNSIAIDTLGNIYFSEDFYIKKKEVNTGVVRIIAGTGVSLNGEKFSADVCAICFPLYNPLYLALDKKGNLFFTDNTPNLKKINLQTGLLTSIAGGGIQYGDFNGDGGLATNATIPGSGYIKIDNFDDIYFGQNFLDVRIRKIDIKTGIINTIAGGNKGASNIDGVLATKASINYSAFTIDKTGNIFYAENSKIRKVDKNTGILSTIAGNGPGMDGSLAINARIGYVTSLTMDNQNNIYFVEASAVRKISGQTGIISTIAGNSMKEGDSGDNASAINAIFNNLPSSIEVDVVGNVYIVDKENAKIRKIDVKTGIITTEVGMNNYSGDGEVGLKANINKPNGIASDKSGHIYFADRFNLRIRKLDKTSGLISTIAGNGSVYPFTSINNLKNDFNGKLAKDVSLNTPVALVFDNKDNLYFLDQRAGRNSSVIFKIDASTGIINVFAGCGNFAGLNATGKVATNIELAEASAISIDKFNNIYVTQSQPSLVYKIDANTNITTVIAGNGKNSYAGDYGQATEASLFYPSGIALDTLGNVYITDFQNQCIRKVVVSSGIITTIAGIGGAFGYQGDGGPSQAAMFMNPTTLSIDKNNNIYVADNDNNRIRKIDSKTGIIYTIAGSGKTLFNGNGLAPEATNINLKLRGGPLDYPGIMIAANGDVYFSDVSNNLIRKVVEPNKIAIPDPTLANPPHKITIHQNKRVASLEMTANEYTDWVKNDFFIYEPKSIPVFQDLYSRFKDNFDHVVFVLNEMRTPTFITYSGVNKEVQNKVKGIGRSIIDYSQAYGSGGKLKSIIQLVSPSGIMYGPFLHELVHQYANFAIDSTKQFEGGFESNVSKGHWGFGGGSTPGQLGGFTQSTLMSNVDGITNKFSVKSFGTFANGGNSVPYNDKELYLMGMTPLSSVNDFDQFSGIKEVSISDNLTKFIASKKTRFTKDVLKNMLGERVPSSINSQKDFKVLFIVLTPRPLNDAEWISYDNQIKQMTLKADEGTSLYNFWEATNGIGSLNSDLTDNLIVPGSIALISPNSVDPTCVGNTFTFRAYPLDNGGKSPTYSWTKNGVDLPNEKSFVFSSNSLKTDDVINCKISNSLDTKISASIKVVVSNTPMAPVISNITLCAGATSNALSSTALSGNSLVWYGTNETGGSGSNSAPIPNTTTAGSTNYFLSQKSVTTGCESTRAKIVVTIKPVPAAPQIKLDAANYLYTGSTGTTWFLGGTLLKDTTQKIFPMTSGTYTAQTNLNGCLSGLSIPYNYLITGTIILKGNEFIKLAPNPFVNQVNFDFNILEYQKLNMEVFEIATGKKVANFQGLTAGMSINLGPLLVGTYIAYVTSDDNKVRYQIKIVKL